MLMNQNPFDVAIIGCGSTGLATAYYLSLHHDINRIALIDPGQAMAFTSAQSGENYRNWWPHPSMVSFTNRSIDLMEEIAKGTDNKINMTRRGYALVTRNTDISDLLKQLQDGLGYEADSLIRIHENSQSDTYQGAHSSDWTQAPIGVDILRNQSLIRNHFPSYAEDVETIIHIRRGGDISSQQLGMHMLDYVREKGAQVITGTVTGIDKGDTFTLLVDNDGVGTNRRLPLKIEIQPFHATCLSPLTSTRST